MELVWRSGFHRRRHLSNSACLSCFVDNQSHDCWGGAGLWLCESEEGLTRSGRALTRPIGHPLRSCGRERGKVGEASSLPRTAYAAVLQCLGDQVRLELTKAFASGSEQIPPKLKTLAIRICSKLLFGANPYRRSESASPGCAREAAPFAARGTGLGLEDRAGVKPASWLAPT